MATTARALVRTVLTDLIRFEERGRADAYLRQPEPSIKVRLGSGRNPRQGWINVDVVGLLCRAAGFGPVERRSAEERTALHPADLHRRESDNVYLETRKRKD